MTKKEALEIINAKLGKGLTGQDTIFSNPGSSLDVWWLEPSNNRLESGFYFILHDKDQKHLLLFQVPKGSLSKSQFRQRPEKDISQIIIPISATIFRDRRGANLSKYFLETIKY